MEQSPHRVAMITGVSGGPGKAIAIMLAELGWSIFMHTESSADEAEATIDEVIAAAEANDMEIQVAGARADLSDPAHREQLLDRAMESLGQIDMLVNAPWDSSAGPVDLLELTQDDYIAQMDATATASIFTTQLIANEMVRQVQGGLIENPRIVTVNSVHAYASSTDSSPQCFARAAMSMMTKLFADRLGDYGINVYELRVGLLSAGADDPAHGQYDALIEQGITPLRRWGRSQDIARAVAAIAEDMLTFSTGEVINIDGGFHLRRL
ncbi:MAG: SDR family oxidoreductase [bacterium]|nr:SDR family oxidoreductase [bacterium]